MKHEKMSIFLMGICLGILTGTWAGWHGGAGRMHAAVDRWYAEHPQKCILAYDWAKVHGPKGHIEKECFLVRP